MILIREGSIAVCIYTKQMRELIGVFRENSFDLIFVSTLTALAIEPDPLTITSEQA
jgi:hypothetical protein